MQRISNYLNPNRKMKYFMKSFLSLSNQERVENTTLIFAKKSWQFSQNKVECVFTMVISSESRMEQYRDVDHREDAPNFMILFSRFNRFQRLYRCWKRVLETKCFNEMLLTKSYRWFTVSVTNFLYKFCHNHSKTH